MTKHRMKNACVLLIFAILLLLYGGVWKEAFIPRMAENVEAETIAQTENGDHTHLITDLSGAFAIILDQTNADFRANYPIDDSFLMWMAARYGNETVADIAYRIYEGESSPELWYEESGCSIHVLWMKYCKDFNYASYQLSNVTWKEGSDPERTVIDFVGDINFDENWYTTAAMEARAEGINDCIMPEIQQELQSADITLVNNEFTYSDRGEPLEGKEYTFRAEPQRVSQLETFGADIVSLGNNHVYDYGAEALVDTMDTLDAAGIPYVGAGNNLEEAEEIQYFIINGRKIAFVSATQIEKYSNYTKEATADEPGVLKTLDPARFLAVIEEAEKYSDYVIAYVHWGLEGLLYPQEDQKQLAERYIAAGADLIIGNHSHRLQGMEYIHGVPVFYGLGNFWFSTGALYTTIVQVRIASDGSISTAMLPCKQQDMTTSLLTEESEKTAFYQYIADLSVNVGITSDGTLSEIFGGEYSEEEIARYPYRSGEFYADRTGAYDLEGIRVDIVGNRLE